MRKLITAHDDFILITGTSWNSDIELDATEICKQNGIITVSILDYWCNYSERFKKGNEYVYPDYYLVMDDMAKKEATESGVDDKILYVVGHPGLDYFVEKRIDRQKTGRLLFLSQPLSELYGMSYGYNEFTAFDGVVKAGEELDYVVNIKFHPKESDEMKSLYAMYAVEGTLEELVGEYDIIIGMTTMGLLQCSLMGVPVISYEPGLAIEDYCIINKLGITAGAFSYEQLLEQIRNINMPSDFEKPIWFDGKSTQRCFDFIKELL